MTPTLRRHRSVSEGLGCQHHVIRKLLPPYHPWSSLINLLPYSPSLWHIACKVVTLYSGNTFDDICIERIVWIYMADKIVIQSIPQG